MNPGPWHILFAIGLNAFPLQSCITPSHCNRFERSIPGVKSERLPQVSQTATYIYLFWHQISQTMRGIFHSAANFDRDIGRWDTSAVTDFLFDFLLFRSDPQHLCVQLQTKVKQIEPCGRFERLLVSEPVLFQYDGNLLQACSFF